MAGKEDTSECPHDDCELMGNLGDRSFIQSGRGEMPQIITKTRVTCSKLCVSASSWDNAC